MKYYAYMRCSTATQMENNGFQEQEVEINKYCKKNNIKISGVFTDGGISGTKENREGLIDLIDVLKDGDRVIVLNTSRLWRNDGVKLFVHRELMKIGADVISIENQKYSIYIKDPTDYLFNAIMEAFDTYERMVIAMKLQKGRRAKAKNGGKPCGSVPFGYKWEGNKVSVEEETAMIVQQMFATYLEMQNTTSVKRMLDEKGAKTTRGKNFSLQTIKNILTNDFYTGILTYDGMKYPGEHDKIIGNDIFSKVKELINRKGK